MTHDFTNFWLIIHNIHNEILAATNVDIGTKSDKAMYFLVQRINR